MLENYNPSLLKYNKYYQKNNILYSSENIKTQEESIQASLNLKKFIEIKAKEFNKEEKDLIETIKQTINVAKNEKMQISIATLYQYLITPEEFEKNEPISNILLLKAKEDMKSFDLNININSINDLFFWDEDEVFSVTI